MRVVLQRVWREPLAQFLVIGAVIFAGSLVARSLHRPVIRIEAEDLNQLVSYWEVQSQRPPTPAELKGMLQDRIDEELLAREAQRLGLDKDDLIIRRRLAQKMAFAREDTASLAEPSDATLHALYAKTQAQFMTPGVVGLRHVFFSADRSDQGAEARRVMAGLAPGQTPKPADPFLLPAFYDDVSLDEIGRDYGVAFEKAAETAPVGVWVGPVPSPYGWHLLKIDHRKPAAIPPFEAVRDQVREAWLTQAQTQANRAFVEGLRKRYRVVVSDVVPQATEAGKAEARGD